MSKKISPKLLLPTIGTLYPPPFHTQCLARERTKLSDQADLTQFGVNLLRLPPNAWSSQRHWHTHEDEFIYVLSGEVVLSTNNNDEILVAGECAGFKAGDDNGHCLKNKSQSDALILEIGSRNPDDEAYYSDIDMKTSKDGTPSIYTKKDGTKIGGIKRRSKAEK